MTTTVIVSAHCPADTEVEVIVTEINVAGNAIETIILQDRDEVVRYAYDGRIIQIRERKKHDVR